MKKKLTAVLGGALLLFLLPACGKEATGEITSMNMDKYMKLGEYKGLTVDYVLAEVTDEAIEEQIKSQMISNSEKIAIKE